MNSPPPLWVAVEGPAGAGKTYLSRLLARRYGARCVMVDEICNYGPDTLEGQVVAALAATGDPFLRTGHPAAETLALLALKARAWSAAHPGRATRLVLEDRGPATVAACQAVILNPSGTPADLLRTARTILAAAAWSRPLPDLNLLITDDPAVCEERFAARTGHRVTDGMRAFTRQAMAVYEMLANHDAARWTVISRAGLSADEALAAMRAACELVLREPERSCA